MSKVTKKNPKGTSFSSPTDKTSVVSRKCTSPIKKLSESGSSSSIPGSVSQPYSGGEGQACKRKVNFVFSEEEIREAKKGRALVQTSEIEISVEPAEQARREQ